jgi:hypothetical protein
MAQMNWKHWLLASLFMIMSSASQAFPVTITIKEAPHEGDFWVKADQTTSDPAENPPSPAPIGDCNCGVEFGVFTFVYDVATFNREIPSISIGLYDHATGKLSDRVVISAHDDGLSDQFGFPIVVEFDSALSTGEIANTGGLYTTAQNCSDIAEFQVANGGGGCFDESQVNSDGFVEVLSPTAANGFLSVQVQSEIEAVPAPATLALLGLGLAGLSVSRRRQAS